MKKNLSLLGAIAVGLMSAGCGKVQARMEIREGNDYYVKEQYAAAIKHYEKARAIDSSFPDLDRLIGYSLIGLYKPDDPNPQNEKNADRAIQELQNYLKKRPKDETAREALINLLLNANRTSQAVKYFEDYLRANPGDIHAVKSIATLYARQGDFPQALNWYEKITLIDSKNPESYYIYGVVLYEKVSKDPPMDEFGNLNLPESLVLIEKGKRALSRAVEMKPDYFEALVYLNILHRVHAAKFETDPVKQQDLIRQADEVRNRAVAITKARKAAAKQG